MVPSNRGNRPTGRAGRAAAPDPRRAAVRPEGPSSARRPVLRIRVCGSAECRIRRVRDFVEVLAANPACPQRNALRAFTASVTTAFVGLRLLVRPPADCRACFPFNSRSGSGPEHRGGASHGRPSQARDVPHIEPAQLSLDLRFKRIAATAIQPPRSGAPSARARAARTENAPRWAGLDELGGAQSMRLCPRHRRYPSAGQPPGKR